MEIRWIFGLIPVPIFYTKALTMSYSAFCWCLFIVIRPEKRGKCNLLEHELVHCKQFYRSIGVYPLMYLISRRYRYKSEIEAYKEQIRLGGVTIEEAANWIIRNYGITGLSIERVKSDLQP
jgi:hypothetical protein